MHWQKIKYQNTLKKLRIKRRYSAKYNTMACCGESSARNTNERWSVTSRRNSISTKIYIYESDVCKTKIFTIDELLELSNIRQTIRDEQLWISTTKIIVNLRWAGNCTKGFLYGELNGGSEEWMIQRLFWVVDSTRFENIKWVIEYKFWRFEDKWK